jgi:hypothetical protein
VRRLHDLGKPAWATADTLYGDISPDHPREDLTELIGLGVNGIITNLPELLRDVLAARATALRQPGGTREPLPRPQGAEVAAPSPPGSPLPTHNPIAITQPGRLTCRP